MGILERRLRREAYLAVSKSRKKAGLLTETAADGDAAAPYAEPSQRRNRAKRFQDCRQFYTQAPDYCDSYGWRKYGEKNIASRDFSRCYYRCTNQPCPAKKKVEQYNNDDPPLYLVSYEEEHKCHAAPSASTHRQVPMPHSAPNPPSLFSSLRLPNLQMGQAEQLQFNPSFSTGVNSEEEEIAPEIKIEIPDSPGTLPTLPCILTPGSMEIETSTPDQCFTSWLNLPPTSPLLMVPECMNQMENYAFDETKDLPPTLSFTALGSHGETSTQDQGSIANSWLNLPAAPCLMWLGSVLVESYPFEYALDEPQHLPPTLSFTPQAGHGEAGVINQNDAVINSADQSASSGVMMPTEFMGMEERDSISNFDSPEFEADYSEILTLWELPNFDTMMYCLPDPL